MKVVRTILQQPIETGEWVAIYPRTSGDMVSGQVENTRTLDGYTEKDFMKSKFDDDIMKVKRSDNKYQGMQASKIFISDKAVSPNMIGDGDLWVKNNIYLHDGDEVATKNDLTEFQTLTLNKVYTTTVKRAETADKLTTARKINNVSFDGSADINIKTFTVQSSAPSDTEKLWINSTDGTINYYYNGKWNPCVGSWG